MSQGAFSAGKSAANGYFEATATGPAGDSAQQPLVKCAATIPIRPTEWLWKGRIALRTITVFDGDPGLGKSTVISEICARVTKGDPLPGDQQRREPGGVALVSYEDDPSAVIVPRLVAAKADLQRVFIWNDEGRPQFTLPDSLGDLLTVIDEHGVRLIVIDPMMAAFTAATNTHRDQDVRRVLSLVAALATSKGVAVVFVRHLNKTGGERALYRGGGSIGIIGAARTGLLLEKDPDNDDARVLAVSKCNLGRIAQSLRLRIVEAPPPAAGVEVGRVEWEGVATVNADDLLAHDEDRGALDDAKAFLRDYLAGGSIRATQVLAAAKSAGIHDRTLRRAKADLRIDSIKRGDTWDWVLPEHKEP